MTRRAARHGSSFACGTRAMLLVWSCGKSIGCWRMSRHPKRHQLRVIDEWGEDYLYPEEYFCRHGIVALAVSLVGNSGAGFVGPRGA